MAEDRLQELEQKLAYKNNELLDSEALLFVAECLYRIL
jgi:hypothetical protein